MGKRLGKVEKPVILINGEPMISYITDALLNSRTIDDVYISTSKNTPRTKNWINNASQTRVINVETSGNGYISDMIEAVERVDLCEPILITVADLPLVYPDIIDKIVIEYNNTRELALSVRIPVHICKDLGIDPETVLKTDGKLLVPVGINILDGERIREEQEEHILILEDERLAINVNTPEDKRICEECLWVVYSVT